MEIYVYGMDGSATETPFCERHVNELFPALVKYGIIEKREEASACAACEQWPEMASVTGQDA